MNIHGYKKKKQETKYDLNKVEGHLDKEKKKRRGQRNKDLIDSYKSQIKKLQRLIIFCNNEANKLRKLRGSKKKKK